MRERLRDFGPTAVSSLSLLKKWAHSLYLQNMWVIVLGRTCNYGSVSTAKPPWNQNVFVTLCRIVLLWQHWLHTSLSGTNAREPTKCWYTGLVLSRLGPAPCDLWPMRGPMTSEVDLHPSMVVSLLGYSWGIGLNHTRSCPQRRVERKSNLQRRNEMKKYMLI